MEVIKNVPQRRVVNPLFSFLCSTDRTLRWRAITAMGIVVSRLAEENLESARVVLRRLMWSLNDESGGIGWGAPEAMGDIMARSAPLAKEYCTILSSYIQPEGNFLESEILQSGVLWAIGRVAHAHGDLMAVVGPFLIPFLNASNPEHRALSAWAAGAIKSPLTFPALNNLTTDTTTIEIFIEGRFEKHPISAIASAALS